MTHNNIISLCTSFEFLNYCEKKNKKSNKTPLCLNVVLIVGQIKTPLCLNLRNKVFPLSYIQISNLIYYLWRTNPRISPLHIG